MAVGSPVWEALCGLGTRRSYAADQHLMRRDDATSTVIAVVDGLCKVVDGSGDGHEALVAVRGPGEIIGELAVLLGTPRTASVIALVPMEAVTVTGTQFDEWLDTAPGAARQVAAMLARRVEETSRPRVGAHHPVEARLAQRILDLHDRFHAPEAPGAQTSPVVQVPLSHEEYASWVGATRAVITRAFGSLRSRGLVDHGRGWVQVLDRPGLERLANLGR